MWLLIFGIVIALLIVSVVYLVNCVGRFDAVKRIAGSGKWTGRLLSFGILAVCFALTAIMVLAAFAGWRINKILNAGQPEYLQQVAKEMAAPFEGELSAMFTAPWYFEFTPLGVEFAHHVIK